MGTLKTRIQDDMKSAMKAGEALRLSTVRMALSELKRYEADHGAEADEATAVAILEKMVKQRRESIAQYEKAARQDLAEQEKFEIGVLAAYLPQQLGEAEVAEAVAAAVAESGAASVKDMGKVMALLKPRLAGKADMGEVSALVRAQLQK